MPPYSKTTWVDGSLPAIDASKLNKIEQGIFDSLRQDGSTTMSGQLVTTAGSAVTPAIAPTGDANTGIFFPAADTIAFGEGGAESMRINSSGQVGIGTTTPTALVSMHGSPQATSGAILTLRDTTATGANTTYGAISFISSPGTDFSIGKASENANSALAFRNANTGAEFMRITSSGNVGIGTTSPGDKLHVVGNIYLGTASQTIYTAGTGNLTLQTNTGNIIFARNNAADTTMFLNNSGNVGIGTNSPTSELHVYSAGSSADIMVETNTSGGDSKIALKCNGTGGRHWYLQTGDNTSTLNGRFRLFDSTAGAERFTITSTGNVGIGTSSISSVFGTTLQVAGSSGGTVEISATNVNLRQFASDGLSLAGVGTSTNHPLQLFTNDAERMRITSGGNVGIGTTSPLTNLHVVGPSGVSSFTGTSRLGLTVTAPASTTDLFGIDFTNASNNPAARIAAKRGASGSSLSFGISNNYVSGITKEAMTIDFEGNVGIGTTTPLNSLQILKNQTSDTAIIVSNVGTSSATTSMSFVLQESASPQGWLRRYRDGSGLTEIGYTNDLAFSGNVASTKAERMRITSAGHVGIGISSPDTVTTNTKVLHVEGQNYGIVLTSSITNAVKGQFITDGNGPWVAFGSRTNHNVVFTSNDVSRLIIEAAGTTRPAANNTYDLGSSSFRWATIYAQNALNTSDLRLKTDIESSSLGLDFITALNPVQYRWIEGGNTVEKVQTGTETVEISPAIPAKPEVIDEEGNVIQEATQEVPAVTEERPVYEEVITPREGVRTHFGLIAQEVKAALPDGLDFAGWCLADKDDADSTQSLGYTQLIAPMIKAIQELNAKVEALEAQLNK